ncbi:type II secretion system protein [Cysteiniphilum halobium]|uniref:type II secretion system protein n=1 Tax=Cysteiniphilum halobium TaxID=2219059 RepID=UPI000E64DE13|nr:type II secretion system protein [Cysteiniphilum halobium]
MDTLQRILHRLSKKKLTKQQQYGYTLIELGLTITVIGVAVVTILYAYYSTKLSYDISQSANQVQTITAAEYEYMLEGSTTIAGSLGDLYNLGYTNVDYALPISSFNTAYHIDPLGDSAFRLSFDTKSNSSCQRIRRLWLTHNNNVIPTCVGSIVNLDIMQRSNAQHIVEKNSQIIA